MKTFIKTKFNIFIVTVFFTVASCTFKNSKEKIERTVSEPTLEGHYFCQGDDPLEKNDYSGKVTIIKTNDTYQFAWDYDFLKKKDVRSLFKGTGVLASDKQLIAVVFNRPKQPAEAGVLIYKIDEATGNLDGLWTLQGRNQVGHEHCQKEVDLSHAPR